MKLYLHILTMQMFFTCSLLAADAESVTEFPPGGNLLDLLSAPSEKQTRSTRDLADKLAGSQVPSRREAESLALDAFQKVGLDMRESWTVTGLSTLGREAPQFSAEGDLVWEVRVIRHAGAPAGVSGLIWVSASNKKTKVLFP